VASAPWVWLSRLVSGCLDGVARASLVAFLLVVMACSAAPSGTNAPSASMAPAPAVPTSAPAAPASAGASSSTSQSSTADKAAGSSAAPASNGAASEALPLDRMVIRNAKLSLQVQDVEVALQKIRAVADADGGYVSSSHSYYVKQGDQDRMIADVTIAVRSDTFDKAVQSVRALATKVENEDGTSQDVTDQYVDLDANLRNLQASEDAILKLTEKADKLADVLTLQRELATVRGQIERIQGQKRLLEHQTSMSTIAIDLHLPPAPELAMVGPAWNPVATFERGWHASLLALETVADLLISIISFGWWLIPFVVAGIVFFQRSRGARAAISPPPTG
jgi:hypothetical protein